MDEDKKCYPCNGLGYHIESTRESDGSIYREKLSCACCDGSGEKDSIEQLKRVYDSDGVLTYSEDSEGYWTKFEYDPDGKLTTTSLRSHYRS